MNISRSWFANYTISPICSKVEISLVEIQNKLDKLVSGFVDGIIDRAIYLQKKEELVKAKISWEQKQKELKKKGAFWLEPMREFLEAAHNAGNLAVSHDFSQIKSFLEKNGSNRVLKEKKLDLFWTRPFDILLKYKALECARDSKNKKGLTTEKVVSPIRWNYSTLCRTKLPKIL